MFKLTATDDKARAGVLKTKHGAVETPFLMPVATKGSVKYMTPALLDDIGNRAIIANALILSQDPGHELSKKLAGCTSSLIISIRSSLILADFR